MRFSKALPDASPFQPREALTGRNARTLAREILAMDERFRSTFKGSPMKRAKLRGLKRYAAVVLGNAGYPDDVDVLTRALDDAEPLVREHCEASIFPHRSWRLLPFEPQARNARLAVTTRGYPHVMVSRRPSSRIRGFAALLAARRGDPVLASRVSQPRISCRRG